MWFLLGSGDGYGRDKTCYCSYQGVYFLKLSSRILSTRSSIGFIINGIADKPIAVTVHVFVIFGRVFNRMLETAHILLIVKPGKKTEANICQVNVSMATNAVFFDTPSTCKP